MMKFGSLIKRRNIETCHKGIVWCGNVEGIKLGGGRFSDIDLSQSRWVLVLNGRNINPVIQTTINVEIDQGDFTIIDWPDGGAPRLSRSFWENILETARNNNITEIVACCTGGHGRTGTALTILAIFGGLVPANSDPVLWIREKYCRYAVETLEQVDYIQRITGRKSEVIPEYEVYLWKNKLSILE